MMNGRRQRKREARRSLKGSWIKGAFIAFLLFSFSMAGTVAEELAGSLMGLSYFTDSSHTPDNYLDDKILLSPAVLLLFFGGYLLSFLLASPLRLGEKLWYLHVSASDQSALSDAFRYYRSIGSYFRSVVFEARLAVRKLLVLLLCFLPTVVFWLILPLFEPLGLPNVLFYLLTSVTVMLFILISSALSLYWTGRYFLAEYIYTLYSCKMRDAFRLSAIIMKKRKNGLFALTLSFLPLFAADLLIFPRFFTLPYRSAVYAQYAQFFMEAYEREKDCAAVRNISPPPNRFATREFPCVPSP